MSMYVTVVRVSPKAFAAIKEKPDVLEGVFDGDEAAMKKLGVTMADQAGFDYRIADDVMEALDELEGEDGDGDGDGDAVFNDLCADGSLDYDAGYGPAFTLSPKAVKKAVNSSASLELDEEVKALFAAAAKAGDHIIGVVS